MTPLTILALLIVGWLAVGLCVALVVGRMFRGRDGVVR